MGGGNLCVPYPGCLCWKALGAAIPLARPPSFSASVTGSRQLQTFIGMWSPWQETQPLHTSKLFFSDFRNFSSLTLSHIKNKQTNTTNEANNRNWNSRRVLSTEILSGIYSVYWDVGWLLKVSFFGCLRCLSFLVCTTPKKCSEVFTSNCDVT